MASTDRLIQPLALRWMAVGEWRAHPARILLAAAAIAIGVALGFAVHLVNQSALNEFARAMRSVNGEADLQIKAIAANGFDEALFARLARHPAIGRISPLVQLDARLGEQKLLLLGLDPLRAAAVTPSLLGRRADGAGGDRLFDPDALYLSAAALAAGHLQVGDRVTVAAAGRSADFTIVGTLPAIGEARAAGVIDIAAAQTRFAQLGRLQRLDLKLRPGRDLASAAEELRTLLPADAALRDETAEERRGDALSRAYRVNLDMLAMVALLTGGFLVFSAQSLSVARRHGQFALLRVLGMGRGALLAQIFAEGALVGLVGSGAGLVLGALLAKLALALFGGDLGGGYFAGGHPELVLSPPAALALLAVGLATALAGSLLPAVTAARAQPAVALKALGDGGDPRRRPGGLVAVALLAAGGLAALGPPLFGLPLLGYLAIGLMLAGGVALMPLLARLLLAPLQRRLWRQVAFDLALRRLWGAPRQAAVALCGIVASTSLTIAMSVMVTSFRGSVDDWLLQVLPADLYLRLDSAGGLDPALQEDLAAAEGVARIRFRKTSLLQLAPDRPNVALLARPFPTADLPLIGSSRPPPPGETPVWISEPFAWLYRLHPGDHLAIPLGGAQRRLFVAGVWRDYSRQHGALLLDADDYQRFSGDRGASEAAIDLRPGADPPAVAAALRAALPSGLRDHVDIGRPGEIRAVALKIFDRSFAVTYALEAIAILVGLSGVAATLSAQTLARVKEFGMLRHIGVQRRQIVAMLAAEGALLGGLGLVAGLALGMAMSQVLIHVVNPQSFHWTMQTRLPWPLFALLAAAMILAAAVTGALAGRRALSADAVRAVREDW